MIKLYLPTFPIKNNGIIFFEICKNNLQQSRCPIISPQSTVEAFLNFEVKYDKPIYSLFDKIIYCKDEI